MAKEIKFKGRIASSGSNGVCIYIPSHIVKVTELKKRLNTHVDCVLDEDGDMITYLSEPEDEDND
jgi:hypothetical protein